RIDEARRGGRGDRLVVIAVVRRVGRGRVDLAGIWVEDDSRDALRLIGDPRGKELLLDPELEPGVDGQRQVGARRPRLGDGRVVEDGHAARVALGHDDPRLATELRLVLLLDTVLAATVAVDEAE